MTTLLRSLLRTVHCTLLRILRRITPSHVLRGIALSSIAFSFVKIFTQGLYTTTETILLILLLVCIALIVFLIEKLHDVELENDKLRGYLRSGIVLFWDEVRDVLRRN